MSYEFASPHFADGNQNLSYSDCPYSKYFLITSDREKFTDRQEVCLADFSRNLDLILRGKRFGLVDDFDYFNGDCCVVEMRTVRRNASSTAILVFDVLLHGYGIDRAGGFYVEPISHRNYIALRYPDDDKGGAA